MGDAGMTPVAYEFAGYRLEPARRALTRADGAAVRLSGKPFETLVYLVERAGDLVDRDELLCRIWPKRVIEDNNLNQAIGTLRRAIGEQHVITVAGRGYQFVTPVRRVTPNGAAVTDASAPAPSPVPAAAETGMLLRVAPQSWPILMAAAAAGVAMVLLLAFGPPRSRSTGLAGAAVSVQPLTSYPGEEIAPAISPEGTRLAFSWEGPTGRRAIYVTQIGVAEPLRLSDAGTAADSDPAWAPNGEWIAFLRRQAPDQFDIMLMRPLGGVARRLHSGRAHSISVEGSPLLGWTPDSSQLLFTQLRDGQEPGGSYGLHRLTIATGEVEDLGLENDTLDYDTSPAVSPDGRWLAFTRFTRTGRLNQVMLQPLGPGFAPAETPRAVPGLEPRIHHSLHWSAASDRLWFAAAGAIFEWPLDGKPDTIHTLGPTYASAWMSIVPRPTGARAAVVVRRSDEDLFSLALDPATHEAIGKPEARAKSSGTDYHPRVSPDGQTLAFVSDRTGSRDVWLANLDGTQARQLTSVGQLVVGYPRWSPDGKSIAFHSSAPGEPRVIYRVDVESGVTTRLFNGCCPGGWSADGRSLYVTELGDINYIARVDVATGRRERLVEGETAMESVDGEFLLFSRSRERGYFRWPLHAAPGSGGETRLVDDYTPATGGLAPVAGGFYYIGLTDDAVPRAIRFYDYARGEAKDVAEVPARTAIGLTVTPDERELLYAAVGGPPEADILLLEFDTRPND